MKYNIFGSEDSLDYDVAVLVDKIPSIQECHNLVTKYDLELSTIYSDKPLNCNLVVSNGYVLTDCFKGTIDEVNNSIYYTYSKHNQKYGCLVKNKMERNIEIKILRVFRTILSFLSRTEDRPIIKKALKSDFIYSFEYLYELDLLDVYEKGVGNSKNITLEHFFKKTTFQIIQLLGLICDNYEYFEKSEMVDFYPKIYKMLYDFKSITKQDVLYLEGLKHIMVTTIKHYYLSNIKNLTEKKLGIVKN